MNRFSASVILLALVVILVAGCSSSTPAPAAATATPILATATSVPPTATSIPPTSAPSAIPPTSAATSSGGAGAPGSLSGALAKVKAATAFRMDMQVSANGAFGLTLDQTPTASATPAPSSNQEITLFSISGEVNKKDSHFKMGGFVAAVLGVDPNKGMEIITVGDKSYIHGPVALLGATGDQWYEMPTQQAGAVEPPLTPDTFLQSLSSNGMNPSDFQKTGSESLDNQSCDVYSAGKDVIAKGFQDLGQATGGSNNNQVIDSGDFRFWVCGDGYLHQMRLNVQGHDQNNPAQKGEFTMVMHLNDINGNISIQAPANAQPLQLPSFLNLGTPTP
jgi:hypothetical protein